MKTILEKTLRKMFLKVVRELYRLIAEDALQPV